MAKPIKPPLDEVSEVDALRLENLDLKMRATNDAFQRARQEFFAALEDAAKRYDFDPKAGDEVAYATRKIMRAPRPAPLEK